MNFLIHRPPPLDRFNLLLNERGAIPKQNFITPSNIITVILVSVVSMIGSICCVSKCILQYLKQTET